MSDMINYHKTINQEICLLKDKLKYLTKHPAENGRFREIILSNTIKKHLPTKYSIGTGFMVKQCQTRGEHETSSQVDLMVYDNSYPVLFREGDFAIVTTNAVRAIIEVKTGYVRSEFSSIYDKANRMGLFVMSNRELGAIPSPFFNGIFYFNKSDLRGREDLIESIITECHRTAQGPDLFPSSCVNHICLSDKIFYKYWNSNREGSKHKLYRLEDLSYSFFISNMLSYLEGQAITDNSFLWYPQDKTFNCYKQF